MNLSCADHTLGKAMSEALREEFFVAIGTHCALTEAPSSFTEGESGVGVISQVQCGPFLHAHLGPLLHAHRHSQ